MRACIAAIILVVCSPGGLVHAQSGTDVSPAIPVHPDVSTVLQLPDAVEGVWSIDGDEIMVQGVGSEVYVRPRPNTPAGVEAFVEVKTRTMHRMFLLRVVARAEDARRKVAVPATSAAACMQDTSTSSPTPAEPAPCAPTPAPSSAPAPAVPEPASAADGEPATVSAVSPGIELSVHAVVGLGFTGLDVAEYEPLVGFQLHHAFSVRLAAARPDAPWGLEVSVSGERLIGSMTYENSSDSQLEVSGSWLRAVVGMRARLERNEWMSSAHVGIGGQLHLRRTKGSEPVVGERELSVSTMESGAVITLGIGLQRRVGQVLLGVEFQARQGSPNDYHAVEALWTVGYSLGQGE